MTLSVAVIGTAGRDKTKPMTLDLWCAMWHDACFRFPAGKEFKLVSGGAPWADHLAISLFNSDKVGKLTVHLSAPLVKKGRLWVFEGEKGTSGGAENYYHDMFTEATSIDGRREIAHALQKGAKVTFQKAAPGYRAMFTRNDLIAKEADAVLAYTFGEKEPPSDSGTRHAWDKIKGRRVHVNLQELSEKTW